MPGFYRPPLDGREEDPFARDGEDKLIRRGYWLGLSDRSLVQLMTKGIGTRLTARRKARASRGHPPRPSDRAGAGPRDPAARAAS